MAAGVRVVFEKFGDYVPRREPASWLAGGKNILAERIEWVVIPDPSTAAAALQRGEVDWVEVVHPDLVPLLRRDRNVIVDIQDPFGWNAFLVMNHLYPPFNDVRARRALLMAISQEDRLGYHGRAVDAEIATRPASVAGKYTLSLLVGWTALIRPWICFAPTVNSGGTDGPRLRRSKRRSQRGTRQRRSMRKKL